MDQGVDHDEMDGILRRCGATWNASQAHGFLCSRLALGGADAAREWLGRVLEGSDAELRDDCAGRLQAVFASTLRALAERQSEFTPMLPADTQPAANRADALANYTFLTGVAQHYFCRTCGVRPFYVPRSNPDGYSVNVRCLDAPPEYRLVPFDLILSRG